jgi:hypothetical protein
VWELSHGGVEVPGREGSIASHKLRERWSNREDGSEVVVGRLTERSLAWRYQLMLYVIIGVLIGARLVRRCNVGQSLEVYEVEVKPVAHRGS